MSQEEMSHDEIVNMIADLNYKISEQITEEMQSEYGLFLTYGSNGAIDFIQFVDFTLWDSDTDRRTYDEHYQKYEPLRDFIVRRIEVYANLIKAINL